MISQKRLRLGTRALCCMVTATADDRRGQVAGIARPLTAGRGRYYLPRHGEADEQFLPLPLPMYIPHFTFVPGTNYLAEHDHANPMLFCACSYFKDGMEVRHWDSHRCSPPSRNLAWILAAAGSRVCVPFTAASSVSSINIYLCTPDVLAGLWLDVIVNCSPMFVSSPCTRISLSLWRYRPKR